VPIGCRPSRQTGPLCHKQTKQSNEKLAFYSKREQQLLLLSICTFLNSNFKSPSFHSRYHSTEKENLKNDAQSFIIQNDNVGTVGAIVSGDIG
jgi:hypothetical protein